jgi:anaerobic ribonucleoside-triphosphate reductase activating protein
LSRLSDNRKTTIQLAKEVSEKFPNKDIWIWSGYTLEEIQADESMKDILKYVDVLVDGPFIEAEKDLSIPFRGSRNQRILRKEDIARLALS